ncbi:MAG: 1-acyl-sn-glycerol-3-phosphate acyltransferase [Acidimicrobiaceae bacterium]|nr:1-acyl-sn-glycerol-3-phosphate acyltransferase [Acidimicrobiaceae bacterium]
MDTTPEARPPAAAAETGPRAVRPAAALLQRLWYGVAQLLVEVVCRIAWRVDIVGQENVPKTGAFVLAPVHRSNIDTLLAGCVTRRRMRFMAKDGVWKYKLIGKVLGSLGGFPVHRGMPDREALRTCEAALRAGEPVVLFPEGRRRFGPVVQELFDGAVFVAGRAGVPIVPVGIGGSEWAMRKGNRMIYPVKVAMTIGEPIEVPSSSEGRVTRPQVRKSTEALQAELQRLFDDAMVRAGRTPSGYSASGGSDPGTEG